MERLLPDIPMPKFLQQLFVSIKGVPREWGYLLSLLCCCFPLFLFSQPEIAEIKYFKDESSLDLSITNIFQGESGILWLLRRNHNPYYRELESRFIQFDGREFHTWNEMPNPDEIAFHFNQLSNNSLVFNNLGPFLNIFDTKSCQFETIELNHFPDSVSQVWSADQDTLPYTFVIRAPSEIGIFSWDGEHIDSISSIPRLEAERSLAGFFYHNDFFWVSDGGISWAKYDQVNKQWKRYTKEDFKGITAIIDKQVPISFENAVVAPNGEIIVAVRYVQPGFFRYIQEQDNFEVISDLPDYLASHTVIKDNAGRVLFISKPHDEKRDLWLLDLDGKFIDYSHLLDTLDANTNCFFSKDFTDHLWVGTTEGLIYIKFRAKEKKVEQLPLPYSMRSMIELEPGKLLLSTELNGWFLWDEVQGTLQPFTIFQEGQPLTTNYCRGFFRDTAGWIWSSNLHGLLKFNPITQEAIFYDATISIQTFTQLKNGHFLLAGDYHPVPIEFDPVNAVFSDFIPVPDENSLLKRFSHTILEAANGFVWIGTNHGLLRYDKQLGEVRLFSKKEGLKGNVILYIHEETDGKLWLGTGEAGVHIFDPETAQFSYFQETDGLANNTVAGILKDADGDMWFSTFNGISCYKPEGNACLNFNEEDGFSHFEFNRYSFYQKPDGRLCFGTVNGINIFDPQALKGPPTSPMLWLTEAQFYDKQEGKQKIHHDNLSHLTTITLPPDNRYFRFRFALSDLENADLHKFAYFLEGYDENWNSLSSRNEVIFNKLPVGNYTLHIKGFNARGERNINSVAIAIQIPQFFYKTWWFIGLCLLAFVIGIYALYRYRLNQVYKMLELRTRIASDLHDDVGGLLTGIAMQTEMLELSQGPPEKSKLQHLRELSQNALSRMRDVVWSIDARRDKIADLLDRMREQAEEMLGPKGIQYKITIHHLNEDKVLPIDIRQNIYLIFKEALSNAVRHAQASRIDISLGNHGTAFEMHIRDNGVGFNPTKKATGLGLDNMKRRAEKMNAVLEFVNRDGFEILVRRAAL